MENDTIRVLLIEDDPVFADLLREMLADDAISQFRFRRTESLSQGLELLSQDRFDLALLDLSLPDCQGLATFARLHRQDPALPIIVLTAIEDETLAVEAVRLGAQDYLFKDRVIGKMLSRSMRYAIERQRLERALRESEQRYKRLLDSTTDYIVTVTVEEGQAVARHHRLDPLGAEGGQIGDR